MNIFNGNIYSFYPIKSILSKLLMYSIVIFNFDHSSLYNSIYTYTSIVFNGNNLTNLIFIIFLINPFNINASIMP